MNQGETCKTALRVQVIEQKSGSKTRNESTCKSWSLKPEKDEDHLDQKPRQVIRRLLPCTTPAFPRP